ncbi:MAG: beta-mannosidase [Maribacter sp.]|jgi:beta-mannosidase
MMRTKLTILLLFLFVGLFAQDNYIEKLLHDNWQFLHNSKWHDAKVPGNNFSDLLEHGIIPDPFVGTNEDSVQWIKHERWVYKTEFAPMPEVFEKEVKELIFEGLDTYADVYLNDNKILSANNQFRSWTVDVSQSLQRGLNELKIIFHPPIEIEKDKIKKQGYELPGGTRTMTRKAGFHYGWDWGATITTAGIWRDIKLVAWSDIKINDFHIEQKNISTSNADLIAHFNYEKNSKDSYYEFEVNGTIKKVELKENKGIISIPFSIKNPKIWQPTGQGKQHLYHIKGAVRLNNKIVAETARKIGLRTVELITDKDKLGKQFYFKINGQPLFMKGSNYIPQDNLQDRVTPQKYRDLLQDVLDANMNMIRVWGGGIYEEDLFYDLCDSLGILVWQDFMFACAMYPGDKDYLENVKQEAKENIIRLRNHPSIVLWCGNNENSEGWHRWGWQDAFSNRERRKVWKAYKKVFIKILPSEVNSLTNLPYWESSPQFGRGNPKHQFEGDAHYWGVWHDAEPFKVLAEKVPRFMSEFGFQSFPQISTIESFAEKEEQNLASDVMNTHQKHPRGNKLINEYMARDYKVPTDFEDFVYVSQVLQGEGMRFGLEAQRRNQPYCMGTLYWQLNDCWPVASWSSRDYYGNWKALHYEARNVFAPLAISHEKDSLALNISIVSDMPTNVNDVLEIKIMDFKGNEIYTKEIAANIPHHSSQVYHTINIKKLGNINLNEVLAVATLKKNKTRNLFYFSKTKDLKLLEENFQYYVLKTSYGYEIDVRSKELTKNIYFYGIDAEYSDNYFTLIPNESKVIKIKTTETDINLLNVKTMNKIHEKY